MKNKKTSLTKRSLIVEKQLGIGGDYQYKALQSHNFLQANWHYNKLAVIGQLLDLYHPKIILDLGTGSGNLELTFASKVKKILGVDYHDEALAFLKSELGKRQIKNVSLINQDILLLAKEEKLGKFDMIFIIDVLEHLEEKSIDNLIANFEKWLNPQGKIVVITPNYGGLWPFLERVIIDKMTSLPHLEKMQHITEFNSQKLLRIFKKHNYRLSRLTTFNTFSFLFPTKFLSGLLNNFELKLSVPFGNLILAVFGI